MLVIGQRVDGRDAGKFGEFLHVALRKRADDRAVNHPAQHARGVLDRFAAAQLDFVRVEKHRLAAQFANADLEGNPRARGRLGKHQRPDLSGQRLLVAPRPLALEHDGVAQDFLNVRARQFFQ